MQATDRIQLAYDKGYCVNRDGMVVSPRGKIRKTHPRGNGRLAFTIKTKQGSMSVPVHRLAALQKFGAATLEVGVETRHLNSDYLDNRPSNIALGSHSQNMMDRPAEVRIAQAKLAAASQRKLTEEEATQLRKDREAGMSYKQLSKKYGISKSSISYIIHRRYYK